MARLGRDGKFGYLLLSIIFSACLAEDLDAATKTLPEVTIPQGTLQGVNMVTRNSRDIYGFKGIPFAEPPVGDLRFKSPVAAGPWSGILNASTETNDCLQAMGRMVSGDEDCLYLNVYTPQLPTSENTSLLPVMVFIYGGGFKGGSNSESSFGPGYLLDKDVLLVVPSYRLGVFGFLSTGDEVAPGNYALKDMVQALVWIRDNIEYFGGDPNQITIFGQSAGAMSVHLLTLSDLTKGLFHRYMTNSGTALCYDAQRPKEVLANQTMVLGESLGCPTNTSTDLVNCLRSANTSQLVDTETLFAVWNRRPHVVWSPTIEPEMEGAFLTVRPSELVDAGKIRDLPSLSCIMREEGFGYASDLYTDGDLYDDFFSHIDVDLPPLLTYGVEVENVTAYTEALKSYYLNNLTADSSVLLPNLTKLSGDAMFGYPAYHANERHLAYATTAQYFCTFEYLGSTSSNSQSYVRHGDDLRYLFPSSYSSQMSEDDWKMVDIMVDLWTSFAITGTPTITDPDNTVVWEQYSSQKNYLRIGNNSDISLANEYDYAADRMKFWDELTAATKWQTPPTTVSGNTVSWDQYSESNNYLQIGNYSDISITNQINYAKERMAVWDKFQDSAEWC